MKIYDRIVNLEVKSSKLIAALGADSGYMPIAEAPISSNGVFELNLPDVVLGYSYLSSPAKVCKNIDIDPRSLKIAIVDAFWLFDPNETIIGYVFQGSTLASVNGRSGEKLVSRWYATHNSQISGYAHCGPHGSAVNLKLNLKKGWNDVVRHFHSDSEASIYIDKNINWMHWFMTLKVDPHQVNLFS